MTIYFSHFSSAVASDKSRKTFANNILAAYITFKLDGIDIDWEYPGRQGAEGNIVNSKDTPNFLSFLIILRATLPPTARISAAVQTSTFLDTEAHPMSDLSDFAQVLDWVTLMNYDVWGCKHAFYFVCTNKLISPFKHLRSLAQMPHFSMHVAIQLRPMQMLWQHSRHGQLQIFLHAN